MYSLMNSHSGLLTQDMFTRMRSRYDGPISLVMFTNGIADFRLIE